MLPRTPPAWVSRYIGLEYESRGRGEETRPGGGFDCWGLARHVLAREFDVEVPSYDREYLNAARTAENGRAIEGGLPTAPFMPVAAGRLRPGDLALLRVKGWPAHVGVAVARGTMLHIEKKTSAILERWDGLRWRHNLVGFYRSRALCRDGALR